MNEFLRGALAMGYIVNAMFFLRYWQRTRDRLFGVFALAFLVLAANQVALVQLGDGHELAAALYLLRLVAFSVVLIGIVDRNLR
jgi:hypothetical protein